MNDGMYDVGLALGKHWAVRDASPEQLERVTALDDGKTWVTGQAQPAEAFTKLVDPSKRDFMGIHDIPSASFVAGFIDGAQVVKHSNQ